MSDQPRFDVGIQRVRAPEAVALFNTVFASEVLVNACWSRAEADGAGLEWATAFLILPLTLHPPTRDSLPTQSRVTLARWAIRHPDLLADMQTRVVTMADPTRRAIRHGLRTGRLGLDRSNLVALKRPRSPGADWPDELRLSARAARLCGRWFSVTETHLAFDLLGLGG